jgi:phage-related protein
VNNVTLEISGFEDSNLTLKHQSIIAADSNFEKIYENADYLVSDKNRPNKYMPMLLLALEPRNVRVL